MLATIHQQEQHSFSPAIKFMNASQDLIIDLAESQGLLKELAEYLKQHPKLMGLEDENYSTAVNEKPSSSGGKQSLFMFMLKKRVTLLHLKVRDMK